MTRQQRWTVGIATCIGVLGFSIMGGLVMVVHRFIEEFSRPHVLLDMAAIAGFGWGVPTVDVEAPLSRQRSFFFKTVDGILLRGEFWAQPQLAPTIVLCHGYRTPRPYLRIMAALGYNYGYNMFFFDFRGHGESDSVMTTGGNAEVRDLEAALTVAARQPETLPGKLIIQGFSMGAAVALLIAPRPDVVAIIADSPYARLDDISRKLAQYALMQACNTKYPRILPLLQPLLAPLTWVLLIIGALIFRLRFGFSFVARPESSFKRWQKHAAKGIQQRPIPIMLVHSIDDPFIPIEHAYHIVAQAKLHHVPLETYFVQGASHCGAYGKDPERYVSVLQSFLKHCLGKDYPIQNN